MGTTANRTVLVELADIHDAVVALEEEVAGGRMSAAEGTKRINNCKRAVTPRELWKASGGRAGARKRSDWHDIRKTVFGAAFILVLAVVGVWVVTVWTGKSVGDGGYIPEPSPSVSVPAEPSG